ncbi:hypothetical protein [Pseudoalteromonas undina]|nr:hypothetical protein [Pseudoalteromonas undina]
MLLRSDHAVKYRSAYSAREPHSKVHLMFLMECVGSEVNAVQLIADG